MPKQPMTDDELRRQLKKVGGMLAELNTLVQDLSSQLEERALSKASASPPAQPVQAVRPRNPHGFLMPSKLTGNFNSANGLVEGQALPNYLFDDQTPKNLADFRSVLAALASAPARQSNRDAIFPVDLENYLADVLTKEINNSEAQRRGIDIIEGKSAVGFNLAAVKASNADNKEANLYVVEDKLRQTMIVAGPEKISPELKERLAQGGVSYVVKSDPNCVSEINEFLATGAKFRGERGLLAWGSTQNVIEDLLRGVTALCEIRDHGKLDYSVNRGYTVGQAIFNAEDKPTVFTAITRPQRAAKA